MHSKINISNQGFFMANNQYTKTAILLHWLIAIGIFAMFALGWYMADLPKDAPKVTSFDLFDLGIYQWQLTEEASPRTLYFNLHKSIGITLLGLIIFRLFWRLTHRAPALLESLTAAEKKIATAGHHSLYMLMIVVPVSGALMTLYSKFGLKWFGFDVFGGLDNAAMRDIFKGGHHLLGIIMVAVIVIHILGAIKHKLIDKDGTMDRMSLCKLCCKGSCKK
jgi:cytochrome b561